MTRLYSQVICLVLSHLLFSSSPCMLKRTECFHLLFHSDAMQLQLRDTRSLAPGRKQVLPDALRMCAEMQLHILPQCTCLYNSCTKYGEHYKLRQRNLQVKKINSLLRYSLLNHLALERSQRRSPMPRDTPLGPHAPLQVLNSSYCHHRGALSGFAHIQLLCDDSLLPGDWGCATQQPRQLAPRLPYLCTA